MKNNVSTCSYRTTWNNHSCTVYSNVLPYSPHFALGWLSNVNTKEDMSCASSHWESLLADIERRAVMQWQPIPLDRMTANIPMANVGKAIGKTLQKSAWDYVSLTTRDEHKTKLCIQPITWVRVPFYGRTICFFFFPIRRHGHLYDACIGRSNLHWFVMLGNDSLQGISIRRFVIASSTWSIRDSFLLRKSIHVGKSLTTSVAWWRLYICWFGDFQSAILDRATWNWWC
jgi:hypothetical protein